MNQQPYRVLIVDDHHLARKAVRSLLAADDTFQVIGEAHNGLEAIRLSDQLLPDLVLMDINMSPMNGLEAAKQLKQQHPHIRIIMLTVSDDVADLFTALQVGAQGYLLKNMDPDEWLSYLHALIDDNSEVARQMADSMFQRFRSVRREQNATTSTAFGAPAAVLTTREREIVRLVAIGDNNRQIAEKLLISENTVKNHMKNILEKLQLENRVQLTAYAYTHELTQA
ncbi:response regulator transcription factor [Paenibacillus albiflavus]|uniref:Response regulator transcription factor n=1 Tax=Paenibacillus albiflavus TaxID=2545760 RepID=A0A4R4E6G0_9BACL|nr:response regulator transcription factor [Paenibacillus albiflavus]TCZ74637.1 response regulator transcription factor [Paenibacillus albiflavus]